MRRLRDDSDPVYGDGTRKEELITMSQDFIDMLCAESSTPEINLIAAVLKSALHDLQSNNEYVRDEAARWLLDDKSTDEFSCTWCLEALDIELPARELLLKADVKSMGIVERVPHRFLSDGYLKRKSA